MVQRQASKGAAVTIDGGIAVIERAEVRDPDLVAYLAQQDAGEHASIVERALRIGLLALRDVGVTVNVDYVEKEFARLVNQTEKAHERAAEAMAASLRETFAGKDGRVPQMLERFLGDKGQLRRLVDDLFDEERRDSAIGRMRTLLAGYFDGDGAVLARMLDPRRDDSPLHGFRTEMREALGEVESRLLRIEAAREARAEERARSTAKGGDFEDEVEAMLGPIARGVGDVVEPVGTVAGDSVGCRKGDLVQTLNPAWTRGLQVRVAVEAKSGRMGLRAITAELDAARRNRGAAVAVAVFRHGCAPTGCAPLTLHGEHVVCEVDPDDPGDVTLDIAIRLARALALAACRERAGDVDVARVRRSLEQMRSHLRAVTSMKTKLTSVAGASREVSTALDTLRQGLIDGIVVVEEELARGDAGDGAQADVA